MPHAYTEDQLVEQPAIGLFAELLVAMKPALAAADREWQEVAVKEAPAFRAITLLNPDENGLSDILAELLDRRASHGQGETFLNLFSLRCGPFGKHPKDRVTVHRESCTISIAKQRRRMDILIDGGKWGIGIENKPWAGEQKDQLQDYANNLEKQFGKNFLLIRLVGRDVDAKSMDEARQKQLSAEGKFASWQYAADLLAWVNECRQHCQAQRVTTFLDEFSRYITAEFVNASNPRADMERKHLLPKLETLIKNDLSHLHCAAAIAEQFPELRQKFVGKLFDEVKKDVLKQIGSGWTVSLCEENFVETAWARFSFQHKSWPEPYWVALESQPKYGWIALGVWHDCDKKHGIKRSVRIQQELRRLGWGKRTGGPWWDALSPLPQPFTEWTTASGFNAVVKGRKDLKEILIKGFVEICSHFEKRLPELLKAGKRKQQ